MKIKRNYKREQKEHEEETDGTNTPFTHRIRQRIDTDAMMMKKKRLMEVGIFECKTGNKT